MSTCRVSRLPKILLDVINLSYMGLQVDGQVAEGLVALVALAETGREGTILLTLDLGLHIHVKLK